MDASSDADPNAIVSPDPTSQVVSHVTGPRRLFLFESGWRIELKVGSDREFCYMTAPGQDYYHRLLDGEIYLARGDEKLCLACAERRGLLSYEPRNLRARIAPPLSEIEPLAPEPGPSA